MRNPLKRVLQGPFTSCARQEADRTRQQAIFEAHFHALCDAVHHGVFLAEPGGTITHANERFRAMLGIAPDGELSGAALTATVVAADRARVTHEWSAAVSRGDSFASEHRVVATGGGEATVRVYASPVAGPGGNVGFVGTVEDVTQLKSVEEQLLASERLLETIADNVPAIISYFDCDERYGYVNRAFEQAYGRSRAATLGCRLSEVLGERDLESSRPLIEMARAGETVCGERCVRRPDGTTMWLRSSLIPHRTPEGALIGFFAMSLDVTSRREAEESLFREKERAQVTLNSISDAVARTDATGRIEFLNPTAERLLGWSHAQAHGRFADEVLALPAEAMARRRLHPVAEVLRAGANETAPVHVETLVTQDGAPLAVDLSVAAIRDRGGEIAGAVAVFRDASVQRRLERRLAWQATHDALTGLRNRRGLAESLEEVLKRGGTHCLLYIDLDRFKAVNDACGHAAGDELLREVAASLAGQVRAADTIARVGGDEFVVLLAHCAPESAAWVAEKMRASIEALRVANDRGIFTIGASIGIAPVIPGTGQTADALLACADSACYTAKASGRNQVVAYDARRVA